MRVASATFEYLPNGTIIIISYREFYTIGFATKSPGNNACRAAHAEAAVSGCS